MPKYMIAGSYSEEGAQALVKAGGSGRQAAVEKALKAVGGKVEAFYFAFGEVDAFVIADLPDNATAAAVALATSTAGLFRARTTVLLTPEEMDAAAKKSGSYRPPGK
jgi:uncharacterized protein with GYD domain